MGRREGTLSVWLRKRSQPGKQLSVTVGGGRELTRVHTNGVAEHWAKSVTNLHASYYVFLFVSLLFYFLFCFETGFLV